MVHETAVLDRMRDLVAQWQAAADRRAVFLDCYMRMTRNMLAAIERGEFRDADWVGRLLRHFADYYFDALDAYERDPQSAPAVWQLAHGATRNPHVLPFQNLLLGVNAHINYDLVLATTDLLRADREALTEAQLADRQTDFHHVNTVIAGTIDEVQAEVLDPAMPLMMLVDIAMGPLDEMLISNLIDQWRHVVWEHVLHLLTALDAGAQAEVIRQVESDTLRIGSLIRV